MNDADVKTILDKMNLIQKNVFERYFITPMVKREFRQLSASLRKFGYRAKSKKVRNAFGKTIGCIWSAVPLEEATKNANRRNGECQFVYTDVRPKNRRTLKGDCTTRAMTYCLSGKMSYDEIEREQYALAARMGTRRNSTGTWEIVITKRGYDKISLNCKIKRSVLAHLLAGVISHPIISRSSGHVAVIDKDGVHDTWDSRGGKCDRLYVFNEDAESIQQLLIGRGYRVTLWKSE